MLRPIARAASPQGLDLRADRDKYKQFCDQLEEVEEGCTKRFEAAQRYGGTAVTIDLDWLPKQIVASSAAQNRSIPVPQLAALAIATFARLATDSKILPTNVRFRYHADDKQFYAPLIEQAGRLADEPIYHALRRPPVFAPTEPTPVENFIDKEKAAVFVPQAIRFSKDGQLEIAPPPASIKSPNEIAFAPASRWSFKTNTALKEPSTARVRAAGTVIVEEDGRVWIVEPTNHFAHLRNTFPKGQIDSKNPHPQQTALKETLEETGLEVELVGFLGDTIGSKGLKTRYYLAKRIGGTPENVGWESQAVKLVPQDQLSDFFENKWSDRDTKVAGMLSDPNEEVARHLSLICPNEVLSKKQISALQGKRQPKKASTEPRKNIYNGCRIGPTNNKGQFQFHDGDENSLNGLFSNFWRGKEIVIDGLHWKTVEHFFQAQKFRDFRGDSAEIRKQKGEIRDKISKADTPGLAKRNACGPLEFDGFSIDWKKLWDRRKVEFMYRAVFEKFSQDEELKKALLATGDAQLIETMPADRFDSFWGAIPTADGDETIGANMLGQILHKVRDDLRNGVTEPDLRYRFNSDTATKW